MKQPWRWFCHKGLETILTSQKWQWGHLQLWKVWNLIYHKGFLYVTLRPTWLHVFPSRLMFIKQFLSQQNHWFYFEGFFVAINVKICERIHSDLQYVCMSKITMPLVKWFIVITPNSWKFMVISFYGLDHRPLVH